jgi:hypothetical protein
METLDGKGARLRQELQEAYDSWGRTGESCAAPRSIAAPLDASACRQAAEMDWFEYLAAKQRLIRGYAERRAGRDGR